MTYPLEDGPVGNEIVREVDTAPVVEIDSIAEPPDGTMYPPDNEPVEVAPEEVGTTSVLLLDGEAGPEGK
jgi:hypothetical protein